MKHIYDALVDHVLNSSIPARDCDISSLYRFAVGNRHPLHDYCNSVSFEKFAEDYRMIERDVQEMFADEDEEDGWDKWECEPSRDDWDVQEMFADE